MPELPRLLAFVSLSLSTGALLAPAKDAPWTALFNGRDLAGWDTYIGPHYNAEKKDFAGEPVGLNRDPDGVFTVVEVDGAPAIRVSGRDFGGLSTLGAFENCQLRLQFKWGKDKFVPKTTSVRDSGLLYHAVGPHAADWFFWMRSFEFQIQEGDCGDYWGLGGVAATVRTRRVVIPVPGAKNGEPSEREIFTYDPAGDLREFHAKNQFGRHCKKAPDAEKPSGEWNTLDLYCVGDTAMHVVNGVVTMVLHDLRQPDASGGFVPLTRGKIQIQSEGAEVYYRDLKFRPIAQLPALMIPGTE